MLRERLTFSLAAGSAALRTDVKVTNPTAHATSFAHWTNVPLVPGGTNELLDDTIFDIPADRINISKRWQHKVISESNRPELLNYVSGTRPSL